jgi:hypothetical protein
VLALEVDAPSSNSLLEGVSETDLVDGAGQVILELLKSSFGEFDQIEILDTRDLLKAIGLAQLEASAEGRLEECVRVVIRALHLLGAGCYRSLLTEERSRVGRSDYRFEAMMKFREQIQGHAMDGVLSSV